LYKALADYHTFVTPICLDIYVILRWKEFRETRTY